MVTQHEEDTLEPGRLSAEKVEVVLIVAQSTTVTRQDKEGCLEWDLEALVLLSDLEMEVGHDLEPHQGLGGRASALRGGNSQLAKQRYLFIPEHGL
jgi:hypothetical protein